MTFEELDELEGLNFDLIVTLSPPAHHKALELTRTVAAGCRILADASIRPASKAAASRSWSAYREVRDTLLAQIRKRFGGTGGRSGKFASKRALLTLALVGEGAPAEREAKQGRVRGRCRALTPTPHPAQLRSPPSPTRGEGKEASALPWLCDSAPFR